MERLARVVVQELMQAIRALVMVGRWPSSEQHARMALGTQSALVLERGQLITGRRVLYAELTLALDRLVAVAWFRR